MTLNSAAFRPARRRGTLVRRNSYAGVCRIGLRLILGVVALAMFLWADSGRAVLLWSDLGSTQVHETGPGNDILEGSLWRDDSATDTLYFKFHVDPASDANTEHYFAAFQLFEGNHERLAVGNALNAFAYGAFALGETGPSNQLVEYIDFKSSNPEPSGIGTFHAYELVQASVERTIVFKVQYVAGGDDMVTVWLDPDLRPGATEDSQLPALTTQFKAHAAFDQIHLRHGGGGDGWTFSEMAIATSFSDFVNAGASGGGGETGFTFRSWQREQGLPENYVRTLAQTPDGYIWVGTDEGVSRFDGVNFFSLGPQEGFQGGPIQTLFGDSRGALWIGSANDGLSCWRRGKLSRFMVSDGLPSHSITALAEGEDGRIWVGTQSGLVTCLNGKLTALSGAEIFSGKSVATIFRDHRGTMWVGVTGAGIFSYQGNKFVPLEDPALDSLLQDPHCLLVDQQDRIWIGAGDAFVLCRDGDQWRRFGMPRHLAVHYISTLAEAPDGTVWAGSVGEGLFEFKSGKLMAVNASSGLSDNLVEALLMDREGKLWIGTHGGLNRLYSKKVSVLSHNEGLDYGIVQGLAEVRPGVIWAAQPKGVYQWDGRIFRRLMLNGLSPQEPFVGALLADHDGSCWVAGVHGLLHYLNSAQAEQENGEPALTNLTVNALAEDSDGAVWAGTRKGELWRFSGGKWLGQTNCPQGHAITAIVSNGKGGLWIGTEGDGLYRARDGRFEKVSGLSSGWIRTLFLDGEGTLWIGTTGGGLSRLQEGVISTYTMREGLLDNTISQILEDDAGNLWLGGDRGIIRVKKSDLADLSAHKIPAVYPQIYGRTDGMFSEECASGFFPAGLRTKTGLLCFPTLKGVVTVDSHHILNSPAPTVVLEQSLVDGVPQTPVLTRRNGNAGTATPDDSMESLRLDPGKHTLEFRYTGLSFDAPERVRFRYRLDRLDSAWVEAGTRRDAFYSFVPPGTYHFQVVACNGDGVWNQGGAEVELKVLPHFWQTWWFIGGGIVAVSILGAGSIRVMEKRRVRRRLQFLEQERALDRERTRIAQDLHDSMGAKLCRISFLSEQVRRRESVPVELQEEIRSMSDDSREVLRSLDEIVWAVNPQKDTLDHLATYIEQYAQEYFSKTGIECQISVPAQLPDRPLSSQTRHHLFLAVHEALTNVLKHSGATQVRIAMICRPTDFEIEVSDNGNGFDPVASESNAPGSSAGFCNGLGNMRRRLTEVGGRFLLQSQAGQGTTIRFILSFIGPVK